MFNPNPLPDPTRRNRNRRNGNNQNQNSTLGEHIQDIITNQNPFFLITLALSLLGLLAQIMPFLLGGIYTTVASLFLALWASLDFAFGARLVSEVPAVMWMVWGAVMGACAAFWLSAPLYGWRNKRAFLFAVPVALMLVTGFVISLTRPVPTQPQLIEIPQPPAATTTQPQTANGNQAVAPPVGGTVANGAVVNAAPR